MRRRTFVLFASFLLVPLSGHAASVDPETGFPKPAFTIPDRPPFQGGHLGPGNTFYVEKTPPDYKLNTVALGPDGRLAALAWDSGRLEIYDLSSGRRVTEFSCGAKKPHGMVFSARSDRLYVVSLGRKMEAFEIPSGRRLARWTAPGGPRKYDVQDFAVDPEGRWLAYATNELSKVVSLDTEHPNPIADLGDAASLALSPDGHHLFGLNRTTLTRYATEGWQVTGRVPILAPGYSTMPVMVRAGTMGNGATTAAVPSTKGLGVYGGEELTGRFVTQQGCAHVAFLKSHGTFMIVSRALTFLAPDGTAACERVRPPSHGIAIDESGTWLALQHPGKVELYRVADVLAGCTAPPP